MVSRFVTRRQNNGEYCVWDYKIGAVAQTVNSQIRHENLGFGQAIDAAIELNGPGRTAKPTPEGPQPAAQQQQQQPQPDDSDKKK
jgi:hypothetical protein